MSQYSIRGTVAKHQSKNFGTTGFLIMKFLIIAALVTAVVANDIIEGEWIIKVKQGANQDVLSRLLKDNFAVDVQKYYNFPTLTLMHAKGSDADINRVRQLPEILLVEPNQWAYTTQTCSVTSHPGVWSLDRIDQTGSLPYTDPADSSATFENNGADGAGTSAHIVDTGIRITHNDYSGRARWGHSAGSLPTEDDNGHGTHCAGTVGSDSYGIAKGAELVACKCMNQFGSGSYNDIIECIDWSAANGADTMNLSLGGGGSSALDSAVAAAVASGTTVVCAAGNSDADACNSSPGREPSCITVGATEVDDQSSSFTNWGTCVDVFAPGTDILSTWHLTDSSTNRISGTSMATPAVVGVCNRYLGSNPGASPAQVASFITGTATPNAINFRAGHGTSPNLLLFTSC